MDNSDTTQTQEDTASSSNIDNTSHQMSPRYVWYYFVTRLWSVFVSLFFITWILAGVSLAVIDGSMAVFLFLIFILVIIICVALYIWARLVYHFYRYELREHEFRKEFGVLNKKYASIPYNRIQNVDIDRSLLQRLFNLSEIKIQTAGEGRGAEGRLPGLSKTEAETLRNTLLQIARQTRGANNDAV